MGDRRLQQVVHALHVVRQNITQKVGVVGCASQVHDDIHTLARAVHALRAQIKA